MVDACSRFSQVELQAGATLLLELHGSRHGLLEQQQQAGRDGWCLAWGMGGWDWYQWGWEPQWVSRWVAHGQGCVLR